MKRKATDTSTIIPPTLQQPLSLRSFAPATLPGKSVLALGISLSLFGASAQAEENTTTANQPEEKVSELETVQIKAKVDTNPYAQPGAPYKAAISGDERHVKSLAETPQTITVLTQKQIQESGRTDLREILQAQPGITLGTGENGNAFGDRYIIRGYEARSDVFVDSLRDPGMTIRESFATEQVEISKGPSSTFAGRGTNGGAINSISKQASTALDFINLQAGAGSDYYHRVTLDGNQQINDQLALRLNLLDAYEQVPDRDPADRERSGVSLSGLFKATDKLNVIADYYFLNADDMPDLGTYIMPDGGKPVDDIAVYAQKQDFLESEVEVFTLRLGYEIDEAWRLQNAVRYGTTDNGYMTTGARGGNRHASDPVAPGAYTISLSTHQGWQEVEYFVDQFNAYFNTELADMKHQFNFGVEYSEQKVLNGVYTNTNTGTSNCRVGGGAGQNGYCILDGNGNLVANLDQLMGRSISKGTWDSDYNVDTLALSVMDTIDLTDRWSAFLGVRMDDFDYDTTTQNTTTLAQTVYAYDDMLWNYQLGTSYKLNREGMVYFNFSTSSEINGGESDLGANCGYGGLCGANPDQVASSEPEETQNLELGTKWDLFGGDLLATAAIFQITKDDVMESVGGAYTSLGTLNTGKNRVQGIELGLSGNITDRLSTQFGVAMMESEVLEAFVVADEGRVLSNFADDSLFLQLRYQASYRFAFGGTATYSSEMYSGQPDTAAAYNNTINDYAYEVPSYTVYDLFASYDVSEKMNLLLNIGNVTNEDYYLAAYRSGAFTYIGDARSAKLTLTYDF